MPVNVYFMAVETATHIAPLEAENQRLRSEVSQLKHELAQLKRLIFGAKSERFVPGSNEEQLTLFEEAPVETAPEPEIVQAHVRKRKPVRQALPDHLPREVIVIEPAVDRSGLKKIGEEVTETLNYHPARLTVTRRVRPKYVNPKTDEIVIAQLPARPIDKGIAEPSLLANVVIEKYVDHLPIYRQVQRFKREGIVLPRSTLEGWVASVANLLVPLHERLCELVLESGYIQADETPIAVQDPAKAIGNKKGKMHRGYYWVYHAPGEKLVVLDYQRGRGRDGPVAFLQDYRGALQSDGYAAYDMFEKQVTAFNCWAHARRYFFEAQDNAKDLAEYALQEIGKLYAIEREIREATHEQRKQVRQERALPILNLFKQWLMQNRSLPKSPWGKAVNYTLSRWDKLERYIEDGQIEIDNNLVENAIRPIALGRKNYLFAGSHDAAQRAAVIYSLMATCKKHDVNPQQWLSDVLARIPTHPHKQIDELLPHLWHNSKG
jgi:transposase